MTAIRKYRRIMYLSWVLRVTLEIKISKHMTYICLGYMDEKVWEKMSRAERNTFMDECFAYDEELRKNGHFTGGEALQEARNATTLRWRGDKVTVTDGPFAETK
jgi:hypothetical protein